MEFPLGCAGIPTGQGTSAPHGGSLFEISPLGPDRPDDHQVEGNVGCGPQRRPAALDQELAARAERDPTKRAHCPGGGLTSGRPASSRRKTALLVAILVGTLP